jgi:hypothetical protein
VGRLATDTVVSASLSGYTSGCALGIHLDDVHTAACHDIVAARAHVSKLLALLLGVLEVCILKEQLPMVDEHHELSHVRHICSV